MAPGYLYNQSSLSCGGESCLSATIITTRIDDSTRCVREEVTIVTAASPRPESFQQREFHSITARNNSSRLANSRDRIAWMDSFLCLIRHNSFAAIFCPANNPERLIGVLRNRWKPNGRFLEPRSQRTSS